MKINVKNYKSDMQISDREEKTLQIAILNIISLINALQTGDDIVMNAIEERGNVGYEVFLSQNVSDEKRESFIGQSQRQIGLFLKMAEMPYKVTID